MWNYAASFAQCAAERLKPAPLCHLSGFRNRAPSGLLSLTVEPLLLDHNAVALLRVVRWQRLPTCQPGRPTWSHADARRVVGLSPPESRARARGADWTRRPRNRGTRPGRRPRLTPTCGPATFRKVAGPQALAAMTTSEWVGNAPHNRRRHILGGANAFLVLGGGLVAVARPPSGTPHQSRDRGREKHCHDKRCHKDAKGNRKAQRHEQ